MPIHQQSATAHAAHKTDLAALKRLASVCLLAAITATGWADEPTEGQNALVDLTGLSLEELMEVRVTSVSRMPEKLHQAAAAVFVITREDIRRSGVTSIPEALRSVPGVEIAHIDANKWAITVRGFNGRFANKLLVLIDGRSVYAPLFSGVFWKAQDVLLEDVDRIEVIRGPGATLWGANAVNGIINIITRHPADTQGILLTGGVGTEERGFGAVRYGGPWGENAWYRLYAKGFRRDCAVDTLGNDASDAWHGGRAGFRLNWDMSVRDDLTLQGDIYDVDADETLMVPSLVSPFMRPAADRNDTSGRNVLGRWRHTFSTSSDLAVQVYYDWTWMTSATSQPDGPFREIRHTVDLDTQHRFGLGANQEIVWGLGYRFTHDRFDGISAFSMTPQSRGDQLFSLFLQDGVSLAGGRLRLIAGSKFELNSYTGLEVQPNLRLSMAPHARHTAWMAVSRAVRTPSRAERDGEIHSPVIPPNASAGSGLPANPMPLPLQVVVNGSQNFGCESLLAWEAGYRAEGNRLSLDLAAFYNVYDNLRTAEAGVPEFRASPGPPHLVLPFEIDNKMGGRTYGAEVAVNLRASDRWRLRGAYTGLHARISVDADSRDTVSKNQEDEHPRHQSALWSHVDLGRGLELSLGGRHVGGIPGLQVNGYVTLDARLGWKPGNGLECGLVGQNLVGAPRFEFTKPGVIGTRPTGVERGIFVLLRWGLRSAGAYR